ncbi:hypothetical protein MCOR02_004929 [Pyricularia oryzae]|nr:hypothetical protein MCOR02_004929 [Pyricularia oryzae]KAI6615545.1 hypothetical protein MCOR14_011205 [Pyricularia oryzae]
MTNPSIATTERATTTSDPAPGVTSSAAAVTNWSAPAQEQLSMSVKAGIGAGAAV